MITPVALSTRRKRRADAPRPASAAASRSSRAAAASADAGGEAPPAIARRITSAAARRASTRRVAAEARHERRCAGPLPELIDGRNDAVVRHACEPTRRSGYHRLSRRDRRPRLIRSPCPSLRFHRQARLRAPTRHDASAASASGRTRSWPKSRRAEELAALDPDLHAALFGAPPGPFSITLAVSAVRRARLPARAGAGEIVTRVPRGRPGRGMSPSRDVPLGRCRGTARAVRDRRPRSTRAKCSSTAGRCRTRASSGCRSSGSSCA